jgi:hypothetical protein
MDKLLPRGFRGFADAYDPRSLSNKMRSQRFGVFEQMIADLPRPVRVLDVGGTVAFWESRGLGDTPNDVHVTLFNMSEVDVPHAGFVSVAGDAADLSRFERDQFDVVFSNSVIEHLFTRERQFAMANEIERIGKRYWVQTPSFWFPIEPHFHVPGWQWLPKRVRTRLLMRRRCGWRGPEPDQTRARTMVDEVRLLRPTELRKMFPTGSLLRERFGGVTKSYVLARGPGIDQRGGRL